MNNAVVKHKQNFFERFNGNVNNVRCQEAPRPQIHTSNNRKREYH